MIELQQALGYVDGPPKDVEQQFKVFVREHADARTKEMLKSTLSGLPAGNIQTRLPPYLYFTKSSGMAEAYVVGLKRDNRVPGFLKGQPGTLNGFLKFSDLEPAFPVIRSVTATKQGDASTYHYTVSRASPESSGKLQRAWRTGPDGKIAEEYPVPPDAKPRTPGTP